MSDVADNTGGATGDTSVITLITEDGTGVAGANCYSTLAEADAYNAERGRSSWSAITEDNRKTCLILGTDFVDKYYKWYGKRKYREQELSFPRIELFDKDNYPVNGIPVALKKACYEAAFLNVKGTAVKSGLFTTKDTNGDVKRKKVDVLEVEYFESESTKTDYTSVYEILNNFLDGLYKTDSDKATCNVGAVWVG